MTCYAAQTANFRQASSFAAELKEDIDLRAAFARSFRPLIESCKDSDGVPCNLTAELHLSDALYQERGEHILLSLVP